MKPKVLYRILLVLVMLVLFALGLWVAVSLTRAMMVYPVPGCRLVKWQLPCQVVPLSMEYSQALFSVTLMSVLVLVTTLMTGMSP